MKTYTSTSAAEDQESTNVWEAFVNYLDSVYFEGASENLDNDLLCFEYNLKVKTRGEKSLFSAEI